MKAYEMFFELGYTLERDDDDYIIYHKKLEQGIVKEVSFCDQLRNFQVCFENDYVGEVPSIDMKLFRAIKKQLEELKWI